MAPPLMACCLWVSDLTLKGMNKGRAATSWYVTKFVTSPGCRERARATLPKPAQSTFMFGSQHCGPGRRRSNPSRGFRWLATLSVAHSGKHFLLGKGRNVLAAFVSAQLVTSTGSMEFTATPDQNKRTDGQVARNLIKI